MIPLSSSPIRVALKNGAAHYGDGALTLRRFSKPDRGGGKFLLSGEKAIGALLTLESELAKVESGDQPEMRPLACGYVAYWTPPETPEDVEAATWAITLSLEPMGRPDKTTPFSIELHELSRIAAAIRAAKA